MLLSKANKTRYRVGWNIRKLIVNEICRNGFMTKYRARVISFIH